MDHESTINTRYKLNFTFLINSWLLANYLDLIDVVKDWSIQYPFLSINSLMERLLYFLKRKTN